MWWARQASPESTGCQAGEHTPPNLLMWAPLYFQTTPPKHTYIQRRGGDRERDREGDRQEGREGERKEERERERTHNFKCDTSYRPTELLPTFYRQKHTCSPRHSLTQRHTEADTQLFRVHVHTSHSHKQCLLPLALPSQRSNSKGPGFQWQAGRRACDSPSLAP